MTNQNGPSGFVIAVTHASGFGLLHFVTVDPAPELVRQPASQRGNYELVYGYLSIRGDVSESL